jgi:hypothetical protein
MAKAKKSGALTYDVHPSVTVYERSIAALEEKTGRSLDEWIRFVRRAGPKDERARRAFLMEHGLGANYAGWIAEHAAGRGEEWTREHYLAAAPGYVDAMFAGAKAGLVPIFEALVRAGRSLGADVRVCPCQTIVPLFRKHVFAQIKPSTRTRVDLGLALRDVPVPARLVDTGGFAKKDRITRRIAISSVDEIDDEVRHWLKVAYDMDA